MGIYSRNRSGSMVASQVACNENYGLSDIGKIMYESAINDNTIFETIVMSDLTESRDLREGALLESEVRNSNKENAKKLLNTIKERLAAFWAKIKGAIKDAIRKFTAYVLRDGKTFAKDFRELMKHKQYTKGAIKDVELYDTDIDIESAAVDTEKFINDSKNAENFDSSELLAKTLSTLVVPEVKTVKEYREAVLKESLKKRDVQPEELLKLIEDASDSVKALREYEKTAEKNVNKIANVIKEAEKNLDKDDDKIDHGKIIRNITAIVSVIETCISANTAVEIYMIKQNVKTARVTLGKIKSEMVDYDVVDANGKSLMGEAAALVDAEDVEAAINSDEPVDDEVDKEIEKIEAEA